MRKNNVTKKWITLFEDANDDLYDGDFTEDDPENPMIKFWFAQAQGNSATPIKSEPVVEPEQNEAWNASLVKEDLNSRAEELIRSLQEDQKALF